ncbi:F-box/kelch-repeat protein At5g26960-like [Aristolochia californica]|uniref:F-box/kelch-repeat protein At5g26960-like n=1 Tax=Aristolochia californica TaxID=171875 RepID=UPI0035E147A4
MVSTEACNSRSFSWLVKSCLPNPHQETRRKASLISRTADNVSPENHNLKCASISSLPDDLLLECLSRVTSSSLPSVALVCRRWSQFVTSTAFYSLRRANDLLRPTLYAVAVSDFGVLSASHRFEPGRPWKTVLFTGAAPAEGLEASSLSHARLVALDSSIYVLGRNASMRYDIWSEIVAPRAPMFHPRKKFAAAAVTGKIYVAGGSRTAAVEEYDPGSDTWRVVSEAPKNRYGCIGAAVESVFYVIGGLKIGNGSRTECPRGEAHMYASSMDLYDVETRAWLRSRHVPNGGCVVAACAAGGYVYVLASHAVELSFWRCDGRRSGPGFGEWCRLTSPPVPAQVRLDGTVRFCCVGVGESVALVQVVGSIDDLLRRSGRSERGLKDGLVLVYECRTGEWNRGSDLPEVLSRAGCVCSEC